MLLVGLVAGAVFLAACSSSSGDESPTTVGAPAGGDSAVSIENFAFGPGDITVSVGDTITWTNDEASVGHTTTSDDGIWNSALLKPGETFEQTFTEAGTFTYFCSIHPSMKASITVEG